MEFLIKKVPDLKEHQFDSKNLNETHAAVDTSCSRCASSIFPASPVSPTNRKQNSGGRRTGNGGENICARCKHNMANEGGDEQNRTQSPKRRSDRKKKAQRENLDWDNLGEKIEDWFEVAKTPGKLRKLYIY